MNIIRRLAIASGSLLLAMALVPGTVAHAAAPQAVPVQHETVTKSVETVVTAADLAPVIHSTVTGARPGEGVIRITTRVCGNARNWQNVAAANGVRPPVYLVLLGQRLTVTCVAGSAPAATQAPTPAIASSGWVNPVCATRIGDGIGAGRDHKGVDLAAPYGTQIRAAAAGTLSVDSQFGTDRYGRPTGAGYYTVINHGNGVWTHYFHESRWAVTSGWVNAGQVIGYVGSTGGSSGPHLHFEVRTGGNWGTVNDPIWFMNSHGVRLGC